MNKYTIITVIAIVVIIAPIAYSGFTIFAADQLKYRWSEPEKFDYFSLSNGGEIEFCNKFLFPANFNKFQISTFYDQKNNGNFIVTNLKLDPHKSIIQNGVFSSDELNVVRYLFMQMDFQFDGGDIRIDPNKLAVNVIIETPIIGIIPYSSSIQYTGFDFFKIMTSKNWDC